MVHPIRIYVFCGNGNDGRSDEKIYRCAASFLGREMENDKKPACGGHSLDSLDADKGFCCGGLPDISRIPGKKPRFAADIGLHFSVSHSGEYWVCAVSRQEVGIDIQQKKYDYNPGIAQRFFHADEYQYLEDNAFDDFFKIWTAKESYVKYTGQGIDGDFSAFSVVKAGRISRRILGAEIKFLTFNNKYCLCLCAKNIDKSLIKPEFLTN